MIGLINSIKETHPVVYWATVVAGGVGIGAMVMKVNEMMATTGNTCPVQPACPVCPTPLPEGAIVTTVNEVSQRVIQEAQSLCAAVFQKGWSAVFNVTTPQ